MRRRRFSYSSSPGGGWVARQSGQLSIPRAESYSILFSLTVHIRRCPSYGYSYIMWEGELGYVHDGGVGLGEGDE